MTMDQLNNAAVQARPEPKRDRYGRYLIPHPETGEEVAWTRATTFAKSIADTWGITDWQMRMTALGLAHRHDILTRVAAVRDPEGQDGKKELRRLIDDAMEHAGRSAKSNLGTALHSFTEQHDLGLDVAIPPPYDADVRAYAKALRDNDIKVRPEYVERIVCITALDEPIAGTFDRLLDVAGRLAVGDVKTGNVAYAWLEIAIQLALYSRAATLWDPVTGVHTPMPEVDQDDAVVMHMPPGAGRCELYKVDLAVGWKGAQLCEQVRAYRKLKDGATLIVAPENAGLGTEADAPPGEPDGPAPEATASTGQPASTPAPADRSEWIVGRLRALKGNAAAMEVVRFQWPRGVAYPGKGKWRDTDVDALAQMLTTAEAAGGVSFPQHDDPAVVAVQETQRTERAEARAAAAPPERVPPWKTPANGRKLTDAQKAKRDEAMAAFKEQPREHVMLMQRWVNEAVRLGVPWPIDTVRGSHIVAAAIACATNLYDPDGPDQLTRAALQFTVCPPDGSQPWVSTWATGAVFSVLSVDEAKTLRDMATKFNEPDGPAAELGQIVVAQSTDEPASNQQEGAN